MYRHPHENHNEFYEVLTEKLTKIGQNSNVIILGDLNINVSSENSVTKEYKFFLLSFGLRNYIKNGATRIGTKSETTIDHVISNIRNKQIKTGVIQYEATDHFPIFGIPKLFLSALKSEPPIYRCNFNENKRDEFCSLLQSKLQDTCNSSNPSPDRDPSTALDMVIENIQAAYNETFPLKKLSQKSCKKF